MTALIGGLKSCNVDCGFDNSIFNNDKQLCHIIRRIKRVKGTKPMNKRLPIMHKILEEVVKQCNNSFNRITIKATICIAFIGFM